MLVVANSDNQRDIAAGLVEMLGRSVHANTPPDAPCCCPSSRPLGLVGMLGSGSASAQEHVTQLLRNLAQDPDNRSAIAKAGAVEGLVKQLEQGSVKAMGMAASGLALIALHSPQYRKMVTQELVKLLASDNEAVRQRASELASPLHLTRTSPASHPHLGCISAGPPARVGGAPRHGRRGEARAEEARGRAGRRRRAAGERPGPPPQGPFPSSLALTPPIIPCR